MDLTKEGKSGAEMVGDGFHSGARPRETAARETRESGSVVTFWRGADGKKRGVE